MVEFLSAETAIGTAGNGLLVVTILITACILLPVALVGIWRLVKWMKREFLFVSFLYDYFFRRKYD